MLTDIKVLTNTGYSMTKNCKLAGSHTVEIIRGEFILLYFVLTNFIDRLMIVF